MKQRHLATEEDKDLRHKLVVVGDGNCGKTSLLVTYVNDAFPEKYVPTIFETHVIEIQGPTGQKMKMVLWDTAGQENYDMLRPISYPGCDVFVVCFSVDNPDSYYNVTNKWIPELRHFSNSVPVVLVGTKTDLRNDTETIEGLAKIRKRPINAEEGIALGTTIGAFAYIECSAKLKEGIDEVFTVAARASVLRKTDSAKKGPNTRQCIIL